MTYLMIYLLVINIISFIVCYVDKKKAQKKAWRISEKTLFGLAIIGGGIGLYSGFKVFRHKTLHKRFMIGVPIIVAIQLAIALYLFISF